MILHRKTGVLLLALRTVLPGSAVVLIAALTPMAAQADLTLQQAITVPAEAMPEGIPVTRGGGAYVIYFKPGWQRRDSGFMIEILDFARNKRSVINAQTSTYYETSIKDWSGKSQLPLELTLKGDVVVSDTGEEKQIAGKAARHYKFTMTLAPKNPKDPKLAALGLEFQVTGDQWTIQDDATAFGAQTKYGFDETPGIVNRFLLRTGMFFKPAAKKLGAIKGVPVEGVTRFKVAVGASAPEEYKKTKMPEYSETLTTTATSDMVIPVAGFQVPQGYKRIGAPKSEEVF